MATTRSLFADLDPFSKNQNTFDELAERAASGDVEALFYAQQQLRYCRGLHGIIKHGFTVGPTTSYRERMLKQFSGVCANMRSDPNYPLIKKFMHKNADNRLVRMLADKIKMAFAQHGAYYALQVGLGGLRSRPAIMTVDVVSDTFSSLGISGYYATKFFGSRAFYGATGRSTPGQRDLMDGALILSGCDYGMPCGPYSGLVVLGCIGSGQCVLGGGTRQYLRDFGYSPAQWADVVKLANFLRQVQPADVAWEMKVVL